MTGNVRCFGASVRGPLHRNEQRPNEDAWLHATGSFGVLAVVCDGMGSKPNARTGSRTACAAVKEAVVRWSRVEEAPPSYLPHLIEVLWRLRIHPIEPSSAATTCLFALATKGGSWVLGGVGDGLVMVKSGTDLQLVIGPRADGFGNETSGLGASRGPRAWNLVALPPTAEKRIAVLATDGISDDLMTDGLGEFCEWLVDGFSDLPPASRTRALAGELRAWPTPHHLDDKTLAVVHSPSATVGAAT